MDVIGEENVSAEVEILAAAAAGLKAMGMPDSAYKIHINNRALLAELLAKSGTAPEHHAAVFLALDKRGKITDDEITALLKAEGLGEESVRQTFSLLGVQTLDQAAELAGPDSPALATLRDLFALAEVYGISDRLVFDIAVIRGLSYYTGIVFEAFDTERKFRAIFGGGRYDSLLTMIGGAPTPAVGLGFGDVVVVEVLKELLGETAAAEKSGVIIGYMFPEQRETATRLARALRENGEKVDLMLARQKPKQFFARASAGTASDAVFIGPDDVAKGVAKRKNLATREETEIALG
jgi:histidyl-tRNA synthetase